LGFSEFYGKLIPFLSIVGGVGLNLTIKLFGREDVDLSGPMNLVDMCHQFILQCQGKEVQTSGTLGSQLLHSCTVNLFFSRGVFLDRSSHVVLLGYFPVKLFRFFKENPPVELEVVLSCTVV